MKTFNEFFYSVDNDINGALNATLCHPIANTKACVHLNFTRLWLSLIAIDDKHKENG